MAHWKHSSYKPETHGHYQCRENDGDIKQHGPESPPGISESSKGFREMSIGLKALNKSSLKKMDIGLVKKLSVITIRPECGVQKMAFGELDLQLVLLRSLSFANLCSHDQSSALLRFKQHFSFVKSASDDDSCHTQLHYPKMKYWEEDTDCCSWDGVTCDMVTGHVIGLDLSCSWLYGIIP
ncbi:hypothetical protein EZV62_008926 [Acer yangbiense]|uniref:Leucine-rich repeat-containing N-terminal plant-type domain-containing protein n=1 Tax=Acer yangbiense TaxID=1000413 RepID=A0A5C7IEW1_9ROSI|nr:hypothetical protein EZV62_008926 [Acer yangbiense]